MNFLCCVLFAIGTTNVGALRYYMTADNIIDELWIDGVSILLDSDTAEYWYRTTIVPLDSHPSTIAIKFTNTGGPGGILTAMSDGSFQTDSTWKYSDVLEEGWETVGFDDSSWPNCVQYDIINTGVWGDKFSWSDTAYWVDKHYNHQGSLWVRKTEELPKCPDGFETEGHLCYKIVPTPQEGCTHDEAEAACAADGTGLFEYRTAEEFEAMRQRIRASAVYKEQKTYWVNQKRTDTSAMWTWGDNGVTVNDELLIWNRGEPNNKAEPELCMNMRGGRYKLNDANCSKTGGYVCSKYLM